MPTNQTAIKRWQELQSNTTLESATFAGGCFWCLEAPYDHATGVKGVIAGYAAESNTSDKENNHLSSSGKHREAVQVFFDPNQVTYRQLVDLFWFQIDATDPDGQFYDRGFKYTTAIYTNSKQQTKDATASMQVLAESGKLEKPLATVIVPLKDFTPADDGHQNFYQKEPEYYQRFEIGSGRKAQKEKMQALLGTGLYQDKNS